MNAGTSYDLHSDDFFEEGIVTSTEPGKAFVLVPDKEACEECSAKMFCKPDSQKTNERTLLVRDPFGVHPGDTVRITIKGSTVVKASIFLYGIPLVLLVGCLFAGMELFSASGSPELWAFVLAIATMGVYFLALFMTGAKNSAMQSLPEIIQHITS